MRRNPKTREQMLLHPQEKGKNRPGKALKVSGRPLIDRRDQDQAFLTSNRVFSSTFLLKSTWLPPSTARHLSRHPNSRFLQRIYIYRKSHIRTNQSIIYSFSQYVIRGPEAEGYGLGRWEQQTYFLNPSTKSSDIPVSCFQTLGRNNENLKL